MSTSADRAARRRAEWTAEVTSPGAPKRELYATLTPTERILALVVLNERAWRAAGRVMPEPMPRAEWPSDIIVGDGRA